jgi:hypothetical protein
MQRGFARVRREWKAGDRIELALPMAARRVLAHEAVQEDVGRVALERGPIVYCVEAADHGGRALNVILPDDAPVTNRHRARLLGGVTVLEAPGLALVRDPGGEVAAEPADIRAIPYYAWNHRGPGEMTVWLAREPERATPPPPPPPDTIAGRARVTASHCWHRDTMAGVNDGVVPLSSRDEEPLRLTWWDHRGSEEWAQCEFDRPTEVSAVEVYWFDDSPAGGCRAPQSWRLEYREGDRWKPVAGASDCGVELDAFNRVSFRPVHTSALRIVVQLQPDFSAGIIEWRIE